MNNRKSNKLPKVLKNARDTREIFGYLFRKAGLWPSHGMVPWDGSVKRVVLFTKDFRDSAVDLLETVPNVSDKVEGLEELRLVQTSISKAGVARLQVLFPKVKVIEVSVDQWEANMDTCLPRYNIETNKFDYPLKEPDRENDIEDQLLRRYGQIPEGLFPRGEQEKK
jgi:hypothetical protein